MNDFVYNSGVRIIMRLRKTWTEQNPKTWTETTFMQAGWHDLWY